jgi:transposase-like protein
VISTVWRRRSWSTEEKVAIIDAAFRRGGSVAAAADRFDVSRALIYPGASRCVPA